MFRLFPDGRSLEDNLFKVIINDAGLLVNHRILRSGGTPVTLERMLERLEL